MDFFFSKLWNKIHGSKEVRILILGLESAGKTTILYQIKMGETVKTVPISEFNVESITYKGLTFTVWDIGTQDKNRILGKQYYHNADCVIFVIDSNDKERIEDAAEEFRKMLTEEELKNVICLVMANKQDLPGAIPPVEIKKILSLEQFKGRKCLVQGTSATTGQGLKEGLDWIAGMLLKRK
jgi:small GTP-binding protein